MQPSIAWPLEHLPAGEEFLMWPPCLQAFGYRIVDRLFATRTIAKGRSFREWHRGSEIAPVFASEGREHDVASFMNRNNSVGLLVAVDGRIVLERYGLGLRPQDRWSTMSTVKSMTAMLVGAAIRDRAIGGVDDPVVAFLPGLAGSAYEGVTVRHLLTMSSGVRWAEDYGDRHSEVNRYSKSLADRVPGGVLRMLRELPRAHPPGTTWNYNTGDTYVLGALVTAAVGMPLAQYMSERIWQPCGMEFDAYYTLESDDGQEIGGSRAGMALRDIARFGQWVLEDGIAGAATVLPARWVDEAAMRAFDVPPQFGRGHREALGITGYGYGWWLTDDGAMLAMGHAGQRIYLDRRLRLLVVSLAAYPEPQYAAPGARNHDTDLQGLIQAVRGQVASEVRATATAG